MASTKAPEITTVGGKKYRKVREGLASVLAPYAEEKQASGKHVRNNDEGSQAVFYNPIQQFNRDLTVLAITIYGEGAVLEKESRFNQKARPGKSKKDKRKQEPSAVSVSESRPEHGLDQVNPRKRKADELRDLAEAEGDGQSTKKARATGELEGEEEELEVAELRADPQAGQNVQVEKPQNNGPPANLEKGAVAAATTSASTKKQTPFTILDALSATGLRALRYAKEIPFATKIVANDLSPASVQNIDLNIDHNEVKGKVYSNLDDARAFMYSKVGNEKPRSGEGYIHRFDVIDIDPYGTAAPFFDASLQALHDGGLLCITCTDAGVFASTGYPEKTFALYGGMPVKGPHSHEGGLRLILNAVAMSAATYGLAVEPLLSLYIDYYARLFIRVHRKQHEVKLLAGTTMTVYNCGHGCGAWVTQPLLRNQSQTSKSGETFYKYSFAQAPLTTPNCEHCGSKMHLCGPMWAGPLHNPYFVQKMIDRVPSLNKDIYGTVDRLQGMLTLALEEDLTLQPANTEETDTSEAQERNDPEHRLIPRLPAKTIDIAPFFIMPTYLAKVIHCATPSEDVMRGALLGLGYRVSRSHCKAGSIKTNASWSVLWEILREFMRTKAPIKEGAVKKGAAGWNILARVRGTERALVSELKDATKDQLWRCDTEDDMKTVLQGMLWRLDNQKPPVETETNGERQSRSGKVDAQVQVEEATQPRRSRSKSPSTPAVSKLNIVFDEKLGKEKSRGKLVRYQQNPRENWGPMHRARGNS